MVAQLSPNGHLYWLHLDYLGSGRKMTNRQQGATSKELSLAPTVARFGSGNFLLMLISHAILPRFHRGSVDAVFPGLEGVSGNYLGSFGQVCRLDLVR